MRKRRPQRLGFEQLDSRIALAADVVAFDVAEPLVAFDVPTAEQAEEPASPQPETEALSRPGLLVHNGFVPICGLDFLRGFHNWEIVESTTFYRHDLPAEWIPEGGVPYWPIAELDGRAMQDDTWYRLPSGDMVTKSWGGDSNRDGTADEFTFDFATMSADAPAQLGLWMNTSMTTTDLPDGQTLVTIDGFYRQAGHTVIYDWTTEGPLSESFVPAAETQQPWIRVGEFVEEFVWEPLVIICVADDYVYEPATAETSGDAPLPYPWPSLGEEWWDLYEEGYEDDDDFVWTVTIDGSSGTYDESWEDDWWDDDWYPDATAPSVAQDDVPISCGDEDDDESWALPAWEGEDDSWEWFDDLDEA